MFGGGFSGGLCPRKTQLLGPPHTEPGGFDSPAVLQVQSEHLRAWRAKDFYGVPRFFNASVDAYFMEQFL